MHGSPAVVFLPNKQTDFAALRVFKQISHLKKNMITNVNRQKTSTKLDMQ